MIPALFLAVPMLLAEPAAQPEPPLPDQIVFADQGNRMTVPVHIEPALSPGPAEAGPFRFIVDTGAERTVISRELAGTLGLPAGRDVRLTAIAGSGAYNTVVIPRIRVGASAGGADVDGRRIEAPALVARNLGAAGLVGLDMLQGHALTIDFDRQTMTVAPSTKRSRAEHFGPDDIVVRARDLFGQLVVTDASYGGTRIRVVLDTGTELSIGNGALRRLVAGRKPAPDAARLTSVTGAELLADMFTMDDVSFADAHFGNLPVAFSDAPPFKRLGLAHKPALLLGMDALRLFGRVRIDFANREVRLERPHDSAGASKRGPAYSVQF